MSTDIRAAAVRLAALRALSDKVTEAYQTARADVAKLLDVGDRKTAVLPSGEPAASITYTHGKTAAKVTDRRAFLAWVKTNRPGEVETVETVRSAYEKALLARVGPGFELEDAVDEQTGEVIPGVQVVESAPYIAVKQDAEHVGNIVRAWADGALSILDAIGIATLPAGNPDDLAAVGSFPIGTGPDVQGVLDCYPDIQP